MSQLDSKASIKLAKTDDSATPVPIPRATKPAKDPAPVNRNDSESTINSYTSEEYRPLIGSLERIRHSRNTHHRNEDGDENRGREREWEGGYRHRHQRYGRHDIRDGQDEIGRLGNWLEWYATDWEHGRAPQAGNCIGLLCVIVCLFAAAVVIGVGLGYLVAWLYGRLRT
jgi:hypothetical protein